MLGLSEEEIAAQNREIAEEARRDAAYRAESAREASTSLERLKAILRGERSTRENNEEYRQRTSGMLPAAPDPDPYFYYRLRNKLPRNSPLHAVYGPLEHGQAMEELVGRNKLMALPLGLAIPGYTLGKATGMITGTRSPASLDEVLEAYKGLLRGLQR